MLIVSSLLKRTLGFIFYVHFMRLNKELHPLESVDQTTHFTIHILLHVSGHGHVNLRLASVRCFGGCCGRLYFDHSSSSARILHKQRSRCLVAGRCSELNCSSETGWSTLGKVAMRAGVRSLHVISRLWEKLSRPVDRNSLQLRLREHPNYGTTATW